MDNDLEVVVLAIKGLTQEEIKEEFAEFFQKMVDKYPGKFGVGLSCITKDSQAYSEILDMSQLMEDN